MDPSLTRALHPEMDVPDARIDRHTCARTVPLHVLSLGMSRTGTSSIKSALQILGYADVYHFFNIYANVADCDMWLEAFDAKYTRRIPPTDTAFWRALFDKLLGHCAAVTDAPANAFAPELVAAYPDARVVLVEREVEAWYRSFEIVIESPFRPDFRVAAALDPAWMGKLHRLVMFWIRCQFGVKKIEDFRRNARSVYAEHYREVRSVVPEGRLLEYELGSGWGPLCAFLGKGVPEGVEFPRINEKKVMKEKMDVLGKKSMGRALWNVGFGIGAVFVAGLAVWWMIA